jgi:hypothetical protein
MIEIYGVTNNKLMAMMTSSLLITLMHVFFSFFLFQVKLYRYLDK